MKLYPGYWPGKKFIVTSDENYVFNEETSKLELIPKGSVITQIEVREDVEEELRDVFRFEFEGKIYWQYYYSIEDDIKGMD